MTRLDWSKAKRPRAKFPGGNAATKAADAILKGDQAKRKLSQQEKRVRAAMPGTAKELAESTGIDVTHVGGSLSRLKAAGLAKREGGCWQRR